MDSLRKLTTKEKALQINLSKDIYGSFAEIGAGQEVAANFFKAGGASGTVAKTMSAYDMSFSDAIYGYCERYVCEPRLMKMLEHEYDLLIERLPHRAPNTKFFAFANTVEALNYKRSNQPHGWIGLRFQCTPGGEYNECVLHVKMSDNDVLLQQQALGTIGVNLIFGCFFFKDAEQLLESLMDGITPGRIEIDMFRLSGPDYSHVDNRLMSLKLVKSGFTHAAMFGPDGNAMQPSEALYKKNVLILRGRFRPVTHVNVDMLLASRRHFKREPDVDRDKIVVLTELTLSDLRMEGEIDETDFLNRVDIICSLGQNVMISNYPEYYKLVDYLSEITKGRKIGIILGIYNLQRVFEEKYYTDLRGGVLEAFGTLFGNNVKIYVYPATKPDEEGEELYTLDNFELPSKLKGLFGYLIDNDKLENIKGANVDNLHIISDNVLSMIKSGEEGWEAMVPRKVVSAVKEKCLFDYPCDTDVSTKELVDKEKQGS
ncbi:TonB-dependent receptor [Fulvivirga sediminis]|uniref:TonB-dependent receptor n=1 Tax=Fulvivirga sediminis TaxID=2803949 RepID=A0A937FAY2_9BACT|nr:TonB-dependent receptor [Fulvivirga sediminis]MBL3658591.1 TonB-dependent receptor [Fulvivirga sediminis]